MPKIFTQEQLLKFANKRFTESTNLKGEAKQKFDDETTILFKKYSNEVGARESKKKAIARNESHKKLVEYYAGADDDRSTSRVFMSNELVNAAHSLKLNEKRLIAIAASRVHKEFLSKDKIEITVKEYMDVFEVSEATAYTDMKNASKTLHERSVIWRSSGTENSDLKQDWLWFNQYDEGHSKITIGFTPKIIQNLKPNIKGKFTFYNLKDFAKLKTLYGQRLFELIMQFADTGNLYLKTEDLVFSTGAPLTYLDDFSKIRNRVINPAIKDIVKKNFKVIFYGRKTQRKVTAVHFAFKKQQSRSVPSEPFHLIAPDSISLK